MTESPQRWNDLRSTRDRHVALLASAAKQYSYLHDANLIDAPLHRNRWANLPQPLGRFNLSPPMRSVTTGRSGSRPDSDRPVVRARRQASHCEAFANAKSPGLI